MISGTYADGSVAREFISTRSMFPSSYGAAVRQKTRWIYGITIQTFKLKDIFKNKDLNSASKYSLYRDWKAKFGNILLGPGYMIFGYFILSLFFDLPTMYPKYSVSWYLMLFLSIMMIERQVLRFMAVKNVYGRKSALISSFFPPILPFRMVIGNIINFHATINAWRMNIVKNKRKKANRRPKWSKTDHEFLEEEIKAIPIAKTPKGTVILTTIDVDEEIVEEVFGENISFVYSTESRILKCINCSDRRDLKDNKILSMERYLEEGLINIEQGILALRYSEDKENIEEVLKTMGLLTNIKEYVKN